LFEAKNVENRTWFTRYRGVLVVHAGKIFDGRGWDWLLGMHRVNEYECRNYTDSGVLLGTVEIYACTLARTSQWHEPGQWGWYRRNPLLFWKPIPWKGRSGLFEVPDEIVSRALESGTQEIRKPGATVFV
jgi:hypothetical protein